MALAWSWMPGCCVHSRTRTSRTGYLYCTSSRAVLLYSCTVNTVFYIDLSFIRWLNSMALQDHVEDIRRWLKEGLKYTEISDKLREMGMRRGASPSNIKRVCQARHPGQRHATLIEISAPNTSTGARACSKQQSSTTCSSTWPH